MTLNQKQVAIIGSGCSGLTAIKTCIDEGLNPVCFEGSSDIGGLWRFSSDLKDGRGGSVSNTTIMNTSKEMMAYSDFPPPKEFPNFMHHTKVLEYYTLFAERFKLLQYIRFNTHVDYVHPNKTRNEDTKQTAESSNDNELDSSIKIKNGQLASRRKSECKICCGNEDENNNKSQKTHTDGEQRLDVNQNEEEITDTFNFNSEDTVKGLENFMDSQKAWAIHIRHKNSGITRILYFDYVLVCTGHHAFINMPTLPGQASFQGRIVHSRDLREPDKLTGRRHVVVGIGNSGCDMAVEISKKNKVFLSTRRGTWLMHRLQSRGLPADIAFSNRMVFATAFSLPNRILNSLSARHLNLQIDHDLYGLRPRHGPIAAHPTVNDELPNRIACGQVVVKTDIRKLDGRTVFFEDGTVEEDIDTIVMATGYRIKYPFLDDTIVDTDSNNNPLYLYMFPTTLTTHSLAIIGCVQPGGALAPVSEMQCRLAVKVFKGEVALPSRNTMVKDIEMKRGRMRNRYVTTPRHTVQVDYIPYMDQLASLVGCKPHIGGMFLRDPLLAIKCVLGPCTAYQYRLSGPGQWNQARETIMTQMDRVVHPLNTRKCHKKKGDNYYYDTLFAIIFVFGIGILVFLCLVYCGIVDAYLLTGKWWRD